MDTTRSDIRAVLRSLIEELTPAERIRLDALMQQHGDVKARVRDFASNLSAQFELVRDRANNGIGHTMGEIFDNFNMEVCLCDDVCSYQSRTTSSTCRSSARTLLL